MSLHQLLSYVGKKYTPEVVAEIERTFAPYVITLVSRSSFNDEVCMTEQIRCVVENGYIILLQFE